MSTHYRTLFVGTLLQESFLSIGGTDDPYTTVDSPFCRDGKGRYTLRGTGIAGALVATLRQIDEVVPSEISGSEKSKTPSVWRTFHSHPDEKTKPAFRQHVAIDAQTGAASEGAAFNLETLPPGTCWPFILEVDTARSKENAEDKARKVLAHWAAGHCLIGREVARGMGWMKLIDLKEYKLSTEHINQWPNAEKSNDYAGYIEKEFGTLAQSIAIAASLVPNTVELTGRIIAGPRKDGYGIDSLSIGGHSSEELMSKWDDGFIKPDGISNAAMAEAFDTDFAVVSVEKDGKRVPYIPGSSLRGPLRHALSRMYPGKEPSQIVEALFGSLKQSAKLLIRDAFVKEGESLQLAWLHMHAEDEFAGGVYGSNKFDRIAVMQGTFEFKMVIEKFTHQDKEAISALKTLAQAGQIGIGGGQWRGHGWLRWEFDEDKNAEVGA